MAAAIWLMIFALIFGVLKYAFARVVQGKSKDQLELEALKERYIQALAKPSLLKSKEKRDREIKEMERKIEELESRLKSSG